MSRPQCPSMGCLSTLLTLGHVSDDCLDISIYYKTCVSSIHSIASIHVAVVAQSSCANSVFRSLKFFTGTCALNLRCVSFASLLSLLSRAILTLTLLPMLCRQPIVERHFGTPASISVNS